MTIKTKTLIFLCLFLIASGHLNSSQGDSLKEIMIENFEPVINTDEETKDDYKEGVFPPGWRHRDKAALEVYSLEREKDGNLYLSAKAKNTGVQIVKKVKIDLNEYPILRWRWRIVKFPSESNVTDKNASDDGASVYAIFPAGFSNRVIKYTWNNFNKKGFEREKGKLRISVLRDDTDPKKMWLNQEVNLLEDYKRLFGKKRAKWLVGIGIMTDSDQTESYAEAHYDDFRIIAVSRSENDEKKPQEGASKAPQKAGSTDDDDHDKDD